MSLFIPPELAGKRLDQVLVALFPDYSRSRITTWIRDGRVQVDGGNQAPKYRVLGGERLDVDFDAPSGDDVDWAPEPMDLDIVHADEALFVINKPAGLVVHPAAGNWSGTLVNGLLHHDPALAQVPRAGVVHRLDKDTTGLMVVARTLKAHAALVAMLQVHDVQREYLALAEGCLTGGGTVEAPIGRHGTDRKRMAVTPGGKHAVTHYRIEERFQHHTLLRVNLETGRTHQIRVHMAHIRHPLVGDRVYGGRQRVPAGIGERMRALLAGFPRQALHATRLSFRHPEDGQVHAWDAPLPDDMAGLLGHVREISE
ncbi:MAG: 23S rRNA pseudouridine(1911/1915/1917) synthase RluD [Gammaproteobacteria bacterium]